MSKKNIDQLFREKLKSFEETPDEKVWRSLETSLDQKKKSRRVVPLWWRLGGVAALLAILFYVINPFGTESADSPAVTDIENEAPTPNKNDASKDEVLIPSNESESSLSSSEEEMPKKDETTDEKLIESSLAESEQKRQVKKDVVVNNREAETNQAEENKPAKATEAIVSNQMKDTDGKQDPYLEVPKNPQAEEKQKTVETLADNTERNNVVENQKDAVTEIAAKEEEVEETAKKSIYDEIEKEQDAIAEVSNNGKWSVGPSVAPVYFSSLGEGSPIHSNFASNSKSGNLNLSYGLSVGYELSKKLSIRSGIHKVDYGYDTNDIAFTSSLTASTATQLDNIDFANASKNLVVESSNSPNAAADDFVLNSEEITAQDPSREGRMVQQFGYLEVPLELNYSLVDSKFGLNLIGGVSSLFLVNNSVSLEADGRSTEIGEANNINSVNFSTNVGLGINYKLSQKVLLNLEPMFKYQLNTFSDSAGNFQPFSVGVYSGLRYRF